MEAKWQEQQADTRENQSIPVDKETGGGRDGAKNTGRRGGGEESADGGEIAGSVEKERNKRIQSIKHTEERLQTVEGGWLGEIEKSQADRSREEWVERQMQRTARCLNSRDKWVINSDVLNVLMTSGEPLCVCARMCVRALSKRLLMLMEWREKERSHQPEVSFHPVRSSICLSKIEGRNQ